MSVAIRRAKLEDYGAVRELATLLSGISADRKVQFAAVLESAEHDLLVAEAEGAVVGYAEMMSYEDLYSGGRSGELLAVFVLECRRGHGVGRALLEDAIRLARARGVQTIHINTEIDNLPAQRLYRSLGARLVDAHMEVEL